MSLSPKITDTKNFTLQPSLFILFLNWTTVEAKICNQVPLLLIESIWFVVECMLSKFGAGKFHTQLFCFEGYHLKIL